MQYMSLLLHQDEDESLLKVDGDRIDSEGGLLPEIKDIHSPRSEAPSRPETPSEAGPKKKISLKDWKKDRSSANTPDRKPEQDLRKQAIKSHKEEQAKKTPDLKPALKPEQKSVSRVPAIKSPVKVEVKAQSSNATPTQHDRESQRPAKKRRLSTEEDDKKITPKIPSLKADAKLKKETAEQEPVKQKTEHKRPMPDMISPILPAESAKRRKKDLPELLGPELPSELSLERLESQMSQRSDEVRNILRGIASPSRVTDKDAPRARADSQNRSSTPNIKVSSPAPKPIASTARPGTPSINGRPATPIKTASPRPRQRHIIVLKYGKKNRKNVQMLLKFEPRKKKESSASTKEPIKTEEKSTTTQPAPKVENVKSEKKRPAESDPDPPAKRPKLEPSVKAERPTTPLPEAAKKPLSAFTTPRKELKSATMQRVMSTDTDAPGTPARDVPRTSTPLAVSHKSLPRTSPGPTSNSVSEELTWTDITTKIFQLGRILKKEGSKLAGEGQGKDKSKGVILLIEGLLCFMLNAGGLAQARPSADPGWSTILPYYMMVHKQSRSYKHLHGLVVQLGAVCRQHLHNEHIRRLSKETFPDDTVSAPTPGSDGNTRSPSSTTSNNRKRFTDLRDELVGNARDLRHAWLEGSKLLPVETIESDYTSTWRKKMSPKDFVKRTPDKLDPKHLPKDFPMPLDVTTNVFEASNFALAFMREWAMIEQIDWKTRIDI